MKERAAAEYVVLKDGEKLKDLRMHASVGTTWQATYALELVKHLCGAWPTGETDAAGRDTVRVPSEDEVVDRAFKLADLAVSALEKRKWTVQLPSADEMVDQGGFLGFTRSRNGEDTARKPLPGTDYAAPPDSRRV